MVKFGVKHEFLSVNADICCIEQNLQYDLYLIEKKILKILVPILQWNILIFKIFHRITRKFLRRLIHYGLWMHISKIIRFAFCTKKLENSKNPPSLFQKKSSMAF